MIFCITISSGPPYWTQLRRAIKDQYRARETEDKGSNYYAAAATYQNAADEWELYDGGRDVEEHGGEHEADAPRTPVDRLGQPPRLSIKMKA